jgi:hypothetical protein
MTKRLTLKPEHLTELTDDELRTAAGGTYTGRPGCILSVGADDCLSYPFLCAETLLCNVK